MSNQLPVNIVKVSKKDGDRWEAWIVSDKVAKLRGDRAERRTVHADSEEDAKAKAFELFAPRYPFMLLSGEYSAVEVAVFCIRAMAENKKWKRPKTADEYVSLIRNHSKKLPDKPVDAITKKELQLLFVDVCNSGLSVGTANKLKSAWSCVFDYLIDQGLMQANPARGNRMPKQNRKTKRMFTESEYNAFCDAIDAALSSQSCEKGSIVRRNLLFGAYIALFTGMRVGEVCGLQRGDIHFVESTIRVERSLTVDGGLHAVSPKTEQSNRTIGMSKELAEAMRAHLDWQATYLTKSRQSARTTPVCCKPDGNPFSPNVMSKAFKRFCTDQVGIELKPNESFHILRHTHASILIASGLDIKTISARLGHASVAITLDVYGHLMTGSESVAANVFNEQHDKMRRSGGFR